MLKNRTAKLTIEFYKQLKLRGKASLTNNQT